jgi:hypothetical protein
MACVQVPSVADQEAAARAARVIEECHVEEVFVDSKFLRAETLTRLAKAIVWAAGPLPRQTGAQSGDWEVRLYLLARFSMIHSDCSLTQRDLQQAKAICWAAGALPQQRGAQSGD